MQDHHRYRPYCLCFSLLLCLPIAVMPSQLSASELSASELSASELSTPELSVAEKRHFIKTASDFLNDNYLFPDKARQIEIRLAQEWERGAFTVLDDPKAFAGKMQALMQEITQDKHLWVIHAPQAAGVGSAVVAEDVDEGLSNKSEKRKKSNFGLPSAKVLEGNIGYLNITKFTSPRLMGPVMAAAAAFLRHVDGLVLDLRARGGGSSYSVELLLSYFLPVETHLFTWHFRGTDQTEQSWTLPYVAGHRFLDIPVVILTSARTFSGSEAFSYAMKHHRRATLVGEQTAGGAHTYKEMRVSDRFLMLVPYGRMVSPTTGENWEAVGVIPDHLVEAAMALETAQEILKERLRTKPES
jgi:retinol-binding protein 3